MTEDSVEAFMKLVREVSRDGPFDASRDVMTASRDVVTSSRDGQFEARHDVMTSSHDVMTSSGDGRLDGLSQDVIMSSCDEIDRARDVMMSERDAFIDGNLSMARDAATSSYEPPLYGRWTLDTNISSTNDAIMSSPERHSRQGVTTVGDQRCEDNMMSREALDVLDYDAVDIDVIGYGVTGKCVTGYNVASDDVIGSGVMGSNVMSHDVIDHIFECDGMSTSRHLTSSEQLSQLCSHDNFACDKRNEQQDCTTGAPSSKSKVIADLISKNSGKQCDKRKKVIDPHRPNRLSHSGEHNRFNPCDAKEKQLLLTDVCNIVRSNLNQTLNCSSNPNALYNSGDGISHSERNRKQVMEGKSTVYASDSNTHGESKRKTVKEECDIVYPNATKPSVECKRKSVMEEMLRHLAIIVAKKDEDDRGTEIVDEWRHLASVIDRALFLVFLFVTVVITAVMMVVIPLTT